MNQPFSLEGRSILVTGGTRGIGRAISLQLARAGATVIANYARNDQAAETLRAAAAEESLALEVLRGDLTLPKGLAAVQERLEQCGESIVSIVHCAATGVHRPFDQLTGKHWDWTMSLNARAFFELVRSLLPVLRDGSAIVAMAKARLRSGKASVGMPQPSVPYGKLSASSPASSPRTPRTRFCTGWS